MFGRACKAARLWQGSSTTRLLTTTASTSYARRLRFPTVHVPHPNLDYDPVLDHPLPNSAYEIGQVEIGEGGEEIEPMEDESVFGRQTPPSFLESADDFNIADEVELTEQEIQQLRRRTLSLRRTVNMTRKGKVPSMSALVVVGNGQGAAGYGEGKAEDVPNAIIKATNRAIKSMTFFDRYDNRTVHHDIEHKFKATRIELRARPPGFGNRSNPYIHEVCHCIGIEDISGKVRGSRNPINVVKGTFEALQNQKVAEDIAKGRGRKLEDVYHQYYGAPSRT
ncbi:hypothetical protein BDF22DRAFT_677340 [Syncephalis plumigaleata]|nr:hypothetical protein BDF22DRAFT_677340 [Syncephalis plumigaleata]